MSSNKLKVLGARAVVKEDKNEGTTKGGIIIPGREKDPTFRGTVVAVGTGALLECGKLVPMEVKVGERVIYTNWSGSPIDIDGEVFVIINERDILAIINE